MGGIRWSDEDWKSYKTTTASKPRAAIFTSRSMDPSLDPKNFKDGFRESTDSPANPESTPIILAVDVTGSMGHLAELIVKKSLGIIMKEIYDRKPVSDPHVLCAAIGDVTCDSAPLQATQFEAGVTALTEQIEKIYIEGGGGGNRGESYNMAYYMAAFMTRTDSFQKRGRKGFIFTIGDEPPLQKLSKEDVKRFTGTDLQSDVTTRGLIDLLTPEWEVFHLRVNNYPGAKEAWEKLLGERAITVTDVDKLAEIIVSTMQIVGGHDTDEVIDSWSGDTSVVVRDAVSSLTASRKAGSGVVAL